MGEKELYKKQQGHFTTCRKFMHQGYQKSKRRNGGKNRGKVGASEEENKEEKRALVPTQEGKYRGGKII